MSERAERSLLVKIWGLLVFCGLILFTVGFWTNYWSKTEVYGDANEGLWFGCLDKDCREIGEFDPHPAWFEAVQAFETIGFIAAIISLVLVILYIFVPATAGKRIVFILSMLACFAAAGCIILGIIIYGAKMDNLSWSFVLCTIAGIIFAISGILLIVDMMKR